MRNIVNKKKVSKNSFEALFKGIPIPTYSWQKVDKDLILIDYNDAADILTKGMMKNYVGTKASELYKNQPDILEELYRCANEKVNFFREMKYDYISTGEVKHLSVMYGFIPPDLVIVHTEDITEKVEVLERLKKSEKELKTLTLKLNERITLSEEMYRSIFENTGTATVIVEEDTTISLVNGQFEELSGYSREEIEWKKCWTDFVSKEDLERMKELHYLRRKDSESTIKKYEFSFVNKENNNRDILLVVDIIHGTKKSVASFLDITERKKAKARLKDSEEKYRYLFHTAQVGLYWSRISDGKILECNDIFAKLFGYKTREELLEDYIATEHYVYPKQRDEMLEAIRKNKEVKNYEIHVTKKDETPIWLSISGRMFEKEDRIEGAAIDITARKKTEQKLKESEEKSRYLIDGISSVGIGIDIVSKDYKVLFQNQVLKEKFGELTGKICYKNYMGLKAPCGSCPMINALKNNRTESTELIAANGNSYEIFSAPYLGSDRNTDKVIEIVMNITERKQAEMALRESEEKYREAFNRVEFYKDIFAHDINNILQTILSGTQINQLILDKHEKFDELKYNAEMIKEQVLRGSKLVSNVRKLSKLEETGQSLENIEILNVLKNTVSFLKRSYQNKNLAIRVESTEEKLFVWANNFLEDVFENLLINAIRHNKRLIIEITVRISKEYQNDINYVKMEFLDNGIGVDDTMKQTIFQRGYCKEKNDFGMGLGLSLVRGIIETFNGMIWVEDRIKGDRSKGSIFVLLIPEVD